ncbi:MAG: chemotaxis protein CheW [Longimicrobiales bacterium]
MSLIDVLVVQLDDLRIGLPADVVREILAATTIAPLPAAPAIVEGVLNVRGLLVPVLDLRTRFGLRAVGVHPDQHFVIANAGARRVALRVDRALNVTSVAPEAFEAADRVVPGVPHVSALARLPDGVLVIHDLERFLSLDEGRDMDEALSAAGEQAAAATEDAG